MNDRERQDHLDSLHISTKGKRLFMEVGDVVIHYNHGLPPPPWQSKQQRVGVVVWKHNSLAKVIWFPENQMTLVPMWNLQCVLTSS